MTASELRQKYIEFFVSKGHVQIPSASLIPENDPTVLFTTAGMHPLVPFLLGENHPAGKRIVNYQRCIRTGDIDLVGDDTHLTFFEMLGNWSFGDPARHASQGEAGGYWKDDAIKWSWEFLTDKKWLGLDPKRIYVTCFAGDKDAPRDDETAKFWKTVGVPEERIAFLGKEDNWWGPAGQTGPCGPDTEMFYQVNTDEDERPSGVAWPKGKYVEFWNDVFMQYNLPSRQAGKTADGTFEPLKQRNVDTGMGLERTLLVLNGVNSIYQTELFAKSLAYIRSKSLQYNERSARIVADHMKTAIFLVADGVLPSNKDQGYVLRRLIRKSLREQTKIGFSTHAIVNELYDFLKESYGTSYPHLLQKREEIIKVINSETLKFIKTLEKGNKYLLKEIPNLQQNPNLAGQVAFDVYQTYGFPPEMTFEILTQENGIVLEQDEFDSLYNEYLQKHKTLSRKGAEQKFAGGLADHSERVVRMHTATHLLHQALKDVLGPDVNQKGSNITAERLRFDFSFPRKVTPGELKKVENIVNEQVQKDLTVTKKILPLEEARKLGATGLFGEKYGETVSVYTIGDYSKEFCGGPHVEHTGQVGKFSILKEEAVSAGVRRIKATVE